MFKLSPSDFAYLYEECKHCYYLKVRYGVYQPSMPMPAVFSAINTRLQGNLIGENLNSLSSGLPSGEVILQEGWVESEIIPGTSVYIKGKYDLLVKNNDGTHTLVDLKISQPDEDKIDKFKTQLSAYQFALENPKSNVTIKVSKLGLLIFYPDQANFKNGVANLSFPPSWFEVPIDEGGFLSFAKKIDGLLQGSIPASNPDCKWCKYRKMDETKLEII